MTNRSSQLSFFVNGQPVNIENPAPELTLLQYLRSIGLTGTKLGCSEGGCGACTVLVSSLERVGGNAGTSTASSKIIHLSVNACLAPLCAMEGKHVITVEGIGNVKNPHPVQERIAKLFGSQCGFCTPGIVMSLYALLRNNPTPTDHEIEDAFDGNLCRCTGYRPILDAAKTFSCGPGTNGCSRSDCCQKVRDIDGQTEEFTSPFGTMQFKKYDPTQEIIFPPALSNRLRSQPAQSLCFTSRRGTWYRPVSLDELLELKDTYPDARIVAGNTEVGIEVKFKNMKYPVLIHPSEIQELQQIQETDAGVEFGCGLSLNKFAAALRSLVREKQELKSRGFTAILENLRWFAGTQVRNVATIAGNIVTASPISDLNPVLVATKSVLRVRSLKGGERTIPMTEFFLGYRKTALQPSEVVISIFVPYTAEYEYVMAYKQAKRRDDDIAIVTSGLRVLMEQGSDGWKVTELCGGFGGMGPTTLPIKNTAEAAKGKLWNETLVQECTEKLLQDLPLSISAPGGMAEYRRALATSFFFKFYLHVTAMLQNKEAIPVREVSAVDEKLRPVSKGTQVFSDRKDTKSVGKTTMHLSALKQVTGSAVYVDDMPQQANELYAALVMSTKAHAKIKSVDTSAALAVPGVIGYVSHTDVPGDNSIGPVFKDEELFATDTVHFAGQLIGLVLAKNQMDAQEGAKLVKVEYEDLPVLVTIEDAIAAKSFFTLTKHMERGDVEKSLNQSKHVIEGDMRIGAQNHFYLETQASLVIPKMEDDEIEIWASTQNPTETQHLVAHALHIPSNKVVCKVKRLGGGFGGKETRSAPLSCALAVAATKFKRPVRCMLDRDEDMMFCGQRHPFLGKYKVGFNDHGKIQALDVQLFSNGGYSADLSIAVMERAVAHSDNIYFIPNIRVHGTVCKTNTFRGFGGPQGMMIAETWISHVAATLKRSPEEIREINMYAENDLTHFNQQLDNFRVPKLWKEIKERFGYKERRKAVEEFNRNNRWKKRGLAIIGTKFGIAFTARFLNQAGALVHVYTDGSVLLTHGGTEMGQGLHTKMAQICAEQLGIPVEDVHISETATDKVANTSPTAASASSDLNGMAVVDACEQIMARLKPFFEQNPQALFKEIVLMAYRERVNLSANGFHKTPGLTYDWNTNSGRLFNYFTFGTAAAEVEIDVLTGDFQVLRADVVMDLGKSLNAGIDIGQIEGAFVQGLGWCTMEETLHFPNGTLFTRGPGNYKIPSFTDIPIDFRVSLLAEADNKYAVHSSKAVGEPPLFLGSVVYFSIRDAIQAARLENNVTGYFRLESPATPERIRMACVDRFCEAARLVRKAGEKEWNVRA